MSLAVQMVHVGACELMQMQAIFALLCNHIYFICIAKMNSSLYGYVNTH